VRRQDEKLWDGSKIMPLYLVPVRTRCRHMAGTWEEHELQLIPLEEQQTIS